MTARAFVLAAAAAAILSSACAAPAPPPAAATGTPADETAIRAMTDRYLAAFNAGDAATLAALVTEDFHCVEPDGTHISGRAAFQQMFQADVAARQAAGLTLTLSATNDYVSWIDVNHAATGGTWTITGVPPGAPSNGSWMGVAARNAAGEWQFKASLAADLMPQSGAGGGH